MKSVPLASHAATWYYNTDSGYHVFYVSRGRGKKPYRMAAPLEPFRFPQKHSQRQKRFIIKNVAVRYAQCRTPEGRSDLNIILFYHLRQIACMLLLYCMGTSRKKRTSGFICYACVCVCVCVNRFPCVTIGTRRVTSLSSVIAAGRDVRATSKRFGRDGRRAATRVTCARYENVCGQRYNSREGKPQSKTASFRKYLYICNNT